MDGYEIAAMNLPAQHVSGDYYDFIPVDEHRLGLAIADVSGKGVPASLVMAMCRTVLSHAAHNRSSAAEVLRQVNRTLYPDIREDMFITNVLRPSSTIKTTPSPWPKPATTPLSSSTPPTPASAVSSPPASPWALTAVKSSIRSSPI
ncbi:MAG: SpoIIE family protein phosphatase [Blastochloris sp.]|nr:SpoIIE family protein phosphatase [Blastochloris sp.]